MPTATSCPQGLRLEGWEGREALTHLDKPVAVGTVVDDGQGLLEPRATDAHHVCDQLAHGNDHLGMHTVKDHHPELPSPAPSVGFWSDRLVTPCCAPARTAEWVHLQQEPSPALSEERR